MHWPAGSAAGFLMVSPQLPGASAGWPHDCAAGVGVGVGVGVGDGDGVGEGVGVGLGDGDGLGDGVGEGLGDGDGVGDGVGVGEGVGVGLGDGDGLGDGEGDGLGVPDGTTNTWSDAVADDVPALAVRLYVVVEEGVTSREPLAATVPMPLSSCTDSAPSTSQLSVTDVPAGTSSGFALNFWIDSPLGSLRLSIHWQPDASRSPVAREAASRERSIRTPQGWIKKRYPT